MPKTKTIPPRCDVPVEDTWDLEKMFRSNAAWEKGYAKLESMIPRFEAFCGTLKQGAARIRECCDFENDFERLAERLGVYAALKMSEDVANPAYQGMVARYTFLATRASEAASFLAPEIQAIPRKVMDAFLKDPTLAPHRFNIEKLLRYRPHILSEKEELLLAMQGEVAGGPSKIFEQLNDADMKFGFVVNESGEKIELSQSSFRSLLESPKRAVRKQAFHQFYTQFQNHQQTLAATLSTSVLQDVYVARARNYPSAREAALFGDNVPVAVYDNLIETVRAHLDVLYRYLDIRRKALGLRDLHSYDTYVSLGGAEKVNIPYPKAVETICAALAPLGDAYVKTLRAGLLEDRWVDRYENQNKRSGAFSYGCYDSPPYILMNYRPDTIDGMFTLAHEGGHSMHSHHSRKAQPYHYSQYTIFVAEVASTFNETLLSDYLLARATSREQRIHLLTREIDEIRGTIFRQTMFAEYEKILHAKAEAGEPITAESLRADYRILLEVYFGPEFVLDEALDLEGMRIPHFYNAFYVYKYATGLSAAIALAEQVRNGGLTERNRYLSFLKSGGAKYPLDQLRDAGVDMESPEPVAKAMTRFAHLLDELEALLLQPANGKRKH